MRKQPPAKPARKRRPAAAAKAGRRAVIPASCRSLDGVYDQLSSALGLPRHFGRNLDALWDCLSGDVPGPFTIVVEDAKALERALGDAGAGFLRLLRDLRHARQDARIVLRRAR
jgi:ribonuclease inhibitor